MTYPNPLSFKPVRLSLQPEDVLFIVFWTRNPYPLEKHLDRLDEIYERAYYFHFTINGMPKTLETNNPSLEFALATFLRLAERYPGQVFWRYDPIVLSDLTPPGYHIEKFAQLAERLDMVRQLVPIATANDMTLYSCCQDALCQIDGVAKSRCVDIETIRQIAPHRYCKLRAAPTRQDCGCYESRDIGYYDSCPHGCIYCYANLNREKAKGFYSSYLQNRVLPMDVAPTLP